MLQEKDVVCHFLVCELYPTTNTSKPQKHKPQKQMEDEVEKLMASMGLTDDHKKEKERRGRDGKKHKKKSKKKHH